MISDFVKSVVGVAVIIVVIVAVVTPTITSLSYNEITNTGYDDQLRYSRISTDEDVSISITYVENKNHLYIDGVDYTDLVGNIESPGTPIIMSNTGMTLIYLTSSGYYSITTRYWNPESDQFDGYYKGGYGSSKEYSIEIENETVTHTGFDTVPALKEPHKFDHGYILDYDGRYGLYSSTGDTTSFIAANSDDYLIEYADHNVILFDQITVVNGSVSSQYGYYNGNTYSSEINATVDVTEEDGVMNYTLPFKSTQSNKDTEYMTIGPISIIQRDLDPTMSSLISTIPLIMIVGLIIGVAGTFLYRRLS